MNWRKLKNPGIGTIHLFDLFVADPEPDAVPPAARYGGYDLAHDKIYLPVAFIGSNRLKDAIERQVPSDGLVPIAENDHGLFIAIDWLEQNLPDDDRIWQQIRQLVKDHPPPAN